MKIDYVRCGSTKNGKRQRRGGVVMVVVQLYTKAM